MTILLNDFIVNATSSKVDGTYSKGSQESFTDFNEQVQEALTQLQDEETQVKPTVDQTDGIIIQESLTQEETEETLEESIVVGLMTPTIVFEENFNQSEEPEVKETETKLESSNSLNIQTGTQTTHVTELESSTIKVPLESISTQKDIPVDLSLWERLTDVDSSGIEGLELKELPQLNWETIERPIGFRPTALELKEPEDESLLFLNKGWSEQTLTGVAEELQIEAPSLGVTRRIEEMMNQFNLPGQSVPTISLIGTESPSLEKPIPTEIQWEQRELLMNQIVNETLSLGEGEYKRLSLTLVPKHLGTMQLEFEMIQGELRGRIVTQSKEITQWMEKAIQSLSSEMISLKTVQVETQAQMNSFMFQQGQSSFGNSSKQSPQTPEVETFFVEEDDVESVMMQDEQLRYIL